MELEALGKARQRAKMKAKVSMRSQKVKRLLSGEMASVTVANLKHPSPSKVATPSRIPPSSPFASQSDAT